MQVTAGMTRWKESEMKKVSIIIPVYNSEKYIEKTLESVLGQTYENIEVIVIDDGSADKSGEIVERIAKEDSRLQYFRIPNGGPGNARNVGVSKATGEYIGFCDGDDIIKPQMYEKLVSYLEKADADIAFCDIFTERDNCCFGFPWEDGKVFCGEEVYSLLMASMIGNESDNSADIPVWGSVVRCLFKRAIIQENDLKLPTDIHFAEDLVFTLNYLKASRAAVICNEPLYYYVCNEESIMNSFFSYKKDMFKARKSLVGYILKVIENLPCENELRKRLVVTERCYYQECVGNACRKAEGRTDKDMKAELKEILSDSAVKAAFRSFDVKDKKRKLSYLMIQKRMAGAIMLYYKIRFR
jgi:glycosyltransferase involved in cell wall biosynthesis